MMIDREVATDPSNDIIRAHQGVRSRLTYRKNINRQPRQTIEKRLLLPWEKRKNVFFFLFFFFFFPRLGCIGQFLRCTRSRGREEKGAPFLFFLFCFSVFSVFLALLYARSGNE